MSQQTWWITYFSLTPFAYLCVVVSTVACWIVLMVLSIASGFDVGMGWLLCLYLTALTCLLFVTCTCMPPRMSKRVPFALLVVSAFTWVCCSVITVGCDCVVIPTSISGFEFSLPSLAITMHWLSTSTICSFKRGVSVDTLSLFPFGLTYWLEEATPLFSSHSLTDVVQRNLTPPSPANLCRSKRQVVKMNIICNSKTWQLPLSKAFKTTRQQNKYYQKDGTRCNYYSHKNRTDPTAVGG